MTGQNTSYIIVRIDKKDFMPFLMIFCQIKSKWNALTIFDNMDIKFFKSCACSITNCFMVIWKPIFCKVLNEMFKKKNLSKFFTNQVFWMWILNKYDLSFIIIFNVRLI